MKAPYPARHAFFALAVVASVIAAGCTTPLRAQNPGYGKPELIYSWTKVAYAACGASAALPLGDRAYDGATVAGVEADRRGNLYVTTPRWLNHDLPATLNRVVTENGKVLLKPFPDCASNALDHSGALRNVLGVEVDSRNRMWILDMGWVAGEARATDDGQKIVVIDLDSGKELARYAFPDSVADRRVSFLNDLTIDERHDVAFISDSGNRSGSPTASGIIVYDLKSNRARRVLDRHPGVRDDPAFTLSVAGEQVLPGGRLAVGINGITMAADGRRLYWGVTTGDGIYSIPTAILLDPAATDEQVAAAVAGPRRIGGGSDGMTTDSRGRIYIANLSASSVQVWDPATDDLITIATGADFAWPDSLTWDDQGGLYVSTNHLNQAFAGTMSYSGREPNFRIFRIQTDTTKAYTK